VPTPGTAGGEKPKRFRPAPAEFLVQPIFYFLILFRSAFALAPRFQRNEEETVVASVGEAEKVEADYRCSCIELPACLREQPLPVSQPRLCVPLMPRWELHADVDIALVFIRHKAGGQPAPKEKRARPKPAKQHQHERTLVN